MGTRSWFFALLAPTVACDGSIGSPEGIERQSPSEVDTGADTGADTGTGADTDAGTDAGTGTGGDPGQCAGGPLADPIPNCDPDTVNGHYESMASTSYTQVACGFFTTPTGNVWGVQNFD